MLQPIDTENNRDKWLRLLRFVEHSFPVGDSAHIERVLVKKGILLGVYTSAGHVRDWVFIHKDVYDNCIGDNWEQEVKVDEELTTDAVLNYLVHEVKQINFGECVLNSV